MLFGTRETYYGMRRSSIPGGKGGGEILQPEYDSAPTQNHNWLVADL